jgi:hypothetical protein
MDDQGIELLRGGDGLVEGIGLEFACDEFRAQCVRALLPALVVLDGCIYICMGLQGVEFLPWEMADHRGQAQGVVGVVSCASLQVSFGCAGKQVCPDLGAD